jgi:hypothetical protein
MARKAVPEETGSDRLIGAPDGRREREPGREHVSVLDPTPPSALAGDLEGFRYAQDRASGALVPPPRPNAVTRSAVSRQPAPAASSEDQELAASLREELEEAVQVVGERQADLLAAKGQEVVEKKAAYDEAVEKRDEVARRLEEVQERLSPDALVRFYVVEGEKEKRVGGDVLRPGKVIDTRNYDPRALRRGGVRLKEIRAEERDQY